MKKIFLLLLSGMLLVAGLFLFESRSKFLKVFKFTVKEIPPSFPAYHPTSKNSNPFQSQKTPHGAYIVVSAGTTDDGKGKICDFLAQQAQFAVRSQGSVPDGHTVKKDGKTYVLHHIPVGILTPHVKCYLAPGMVIDLKGLFNEIEGLQKQDIVMEDRLKISTAAHMQMPYHSVLDTLGRKAKRRHSAAGVRKGVSAAASDKRLGIGLRIADLWSKDFPEMLKERLKIANDIITKIYKHKPLYYDPILEDFMEYRDKLEPYVRDRVELKLNQLLKQGQRGIFEGAHGTFLDITHGIYPYTSPTESTAAAIAAAAGVGPTKITHTLGVVKSYATCEGDGPFTTEIKDPATLQRFRDKNKDTSGADRYRYGWIDAVMVRQAMFINGMNSIAISRLDDLDGFEKIKVCIDYDYKENPEDVDVQHFDYPPPRLRQLKKVTPHYIEFDGWKESTKDATHLSQLPVNARVFVKRLEALFNVPVSIVSVGPRQDQTIVVNDFFK
ncbi:MAG: adenylosuccinate synthase [Alteromonas naphthalenivorans]|jgi:adenylosuccinate synthase